jgi:hypothetical protein
MGGYSTWRSRAGRRAAARLEGQSRRSVVLGRLDGGDGFEEEAAGVVGVAAPPPAAAAGPELGEISMGLDG